MESKPGVAPRKYDGSDIDPEERDFTWDFTGISLVWDEKTRENQGKTTKK